MTMQDQRDRAGEFAGLIAAGIICLLWVIFIVRMMREAGVGR